MYTATSVSWQQFGDNPVFPFRDTDVRVSASVSWQQFGENRAFPFRDTDVRVPASVSWQQMVATDQRFLTL